MRNLETRVAQLEGRQLNADLKVMSDEELSAYIDTLKGESPAWGDLKGGTSRWWGAVLHSVGRHPSAFKVVVDDPAYAVREHGIV